jgi:uncharacterized DUF497 family protein
MSLFEWDEAKRESNLRKHGVDFVDAAEALGGPTLSWVDDRRPYGEVREVVVARLGSALLTIVCTKREGRCRIISARRSSAKEKAAYRALRPRDP